MFRLLLSALIVSATAASGAAQHVQSWVNVETETGKAILGFAERDEPYAPGVLPAVVEVFEAPDVVDKSGRVISALKYYGWKVGTMTTVVVLAEVAVEGAPNQLYPYKSRQLKTVELTRYTLAAGAVQKVEALGTSLVRTLRMTTR